MIKFNEMNIVQKVDHLSDMLAECIFSMGCKPFQELLQGQQLQVKQDFHQALKAEEIQLTDEIIKTVEEEFPTSPLGSFLREYGYTVTQSSEFTEAVEQLTEGRKVTIMKFNDFGWPVVFNTVIERLEVKPYAQYKESLKIIHKPKRKRSLYSNLILPKEELLVFDGWLDIDTDNLMYNVTKDNEHVTVKQSKFGCFDSQFMADALNSVGVKPIVQINH